MGGPAATLASPEAGAVRCGPRYAVSMKRAAFALAALLALPACKSSAPYTVPAAIVNTGLAAGLSAAQRQAGGCYAVCTHGMVCNPRTGYCETEEKGQFCEEAPGGGVRCAALSIDVGQTTRAPAAPGGPAGAGLPQGISPATGTAPPPPAESSPRNAP